MRITVTFTDLSPEAAEELKGYVRQGLLVVSAVAQWNDKTQSAPVLQYGERLGIEAFRKYFEMDKAGAKSGELQEFYAKELKVTFADLPTAKTKPQMEDALRVFEVSHPDLCALIPSEDQFYGVSRGANKIEKYLQWVYIPAVKDAVTEQAETKNSAIGKLLQRRVHSQLSLDGAVEGIKQEAISKYRDLLTSNQSLLEQLSASLNARFQQWAHQDASLFLQWQDQDKAVSITKPTAEVKAEEGLFRGDLARFGHGLQRSFIFALLEESAEHTDNGPRLILGCEEPELYQHPPQARHLAAVLQKLSTQNAEVMVCTHSPYFVSGKSFENVRLACKASDGSVNLKRVEFASVARAVAAVTGGTIAKPGGMAARIDQEMESPMNEMFFCSFRVFVEGLEDVAYVNAYLSLLGHWDEFRSLGGYIIPVQGKNHLINALAIANEFALPYFVIFDSDGDTPPDDPAKPTGRRTQHEKENRAIFALAGFGSADAFPPDIVIAENLAAWPTKMSDIIKAEIGAEHLTAAKDAVRTQYGINVADMDKNGLFIGYTMAEAWEKGRTSATLSALCEKIVSAGRKTRTVAVKESNAAPAVVGVD